MHLPILAYSCIYMAYYGIIQCIYLSLHISAFILPIIWAQIVHFRILVYPCIHIAYMGPYSALPYPRMSLHLYCLYGIIMCIYLSLHITAFILLLCTIQCFSLSLHISAFILPIWDHTVHFPILAYPCIHSRWFYYLTKCTTYENNLLLKSSFRKRDIILGSS